MTNIAAVFEKGAWPNSFSPLITKRTINFEKLFSLDVVHTILIVFRANSCLFTN